MGLLQQLPDVRWPFGCVSSPKSVAGQRLHSVRRSTASTVNGFHLAVESTVFSLSHETCVCYRDNKTRSCNRAGGSLGCSSFVVDRARCPVVSVAERRVLSYRVIKVEVGVRSNLRFDDERQKGPGSASKPASTNGYARRWPLRSRQHQASAKEIHSIPGDTNSLGIFVLISDSSCFVSSRFDYTRLLFIDFSLTMANVFGCFAQTRDAWSGPRGGGIPAGTYDF